MRWAYLSLLFAAFACSGNTLTVFNWQYYLSESVSARWETEQSQSVEQIFFDSDGERDRILTSSPAGAFDLVIVDMLSAGLLGNSGALTRLNDEARDAMPNLRHIDPHWMKQCSDFAVPYFWGAMGLAYRSDKIIPPPASWHTLMTPPQALKGHIGMISDYWDMLLPSVILSGTDFSEIDQGVLEKTYNRLRKQIPYVLHYGYPISYIEAHPDDDALHLAMAYSGDEVTLNELAPHNNWLFVVPQEGSLLWVDCIAIPATSAQKEQAMAFINYLNAPDIAALNASDVGNASPNQAAIEILKANGSYNPSLYLSDTAVHKSEFYTSLPRGTAILRSRIINAILKEHQQEKR